ncbi:choice-of-anchor D domain-containing protein [Myxococcota bacterium]|nr:choice-of-anchor D domain-containing protein [Myxococcota bacterium]
MSKRVETFMTKSTWICVGLGLAMSVAGCECDEGPGLTKSSPEIRLDPLAIDFGEVPLGATKLVPVQVQNRGTDKLRICVEGTTLEICTTPSGIVPSDAPFAARFENVDTEVSGAWIVDENSDRELTVGFTPIAAGAFDGALVLHHNVTRAPTSTVTLTGVGVEPMVSFNSEVLDFGQVTVGRRKTLDLVMTNGTQFAQPVRIDPLAQASVIFGTAADGGADTPADQPFIGEVPGNGTLVVKVWYLPPEEGRHDNVLNVTYCPTCSKQITLTGQGIKPLFTLEPALLDFGTLDEGVPGTQSFVVRNVGNVDLEVANVAPEAGTSPEFQVAPQAGLPAVVGAGQTLTVAVTYTGVTPGRDEGRVQVDTNAWDDPGTPQNDSTGFVALQAISVGPDIDPLPAAVNFGTVPINGTPASRNLVLQNAGNAPLVISAITLNTATPELRLTTQPALPVTIDPAGSVQLAITYAPVDGGPDSAELIVASNDRDESTLILPVNGVGGVPTTCSVAVAPTQVTFGLVERGRQARLPVEIRNAGAQPCTVSNLALVGATEFSLASAPPAALNIPPGSTSRIEVVYAPTQYGNHTTLLSFNADDPAQPMVSVPISGTSAPSDLLVVPSQLDFNVVPVTCRSPNRAITLYNTGSNNITITQVYLDPSTSPEFELAPYAVPTVIPPGGSSVLNLRYHPTDIGVDTGVLFIAHTAGAVPVAVPLSGDGQVSAQVTDTFNQLPTPQADVLFVVDNSGSMSEEQTSLGANVASFLSFAQQQSIDYQIAVTTTDVDFGGEQGRFVIGPNGQKIITPQTPNGNNVFRDLVNGLGTGGSGIEQGLEAAYLALSDPLINTDNAGFLRVDAALAIIIVSDEEDYSSRQQTFYENFFRNIKGFQNSSMFSFSAVVGTTNPTCSSISGNADYGSRYIGVAQATGGVVESICNANWGQTLANIGLNTFGLKRSFALSSQPVPVTISVTVDGVATPSVTPGGQQNWSYDQGTNSVVFTTSATPDANSVITVTYTVACLP